MKSIHAMTWGAIVGAFLALLFLLSWFGSEAARKPIDDVFWHRNHEGFMASGTIVGALVGAILGYFAFKNGDSPKKSNHVGNDVAENN